MTDEVIINLPCEAMFVKNGQVFGACAEETREEAIAKILSSDPKAKVLVIRFQEGKNRCPVIVNGAVEPGNTCRHIAYSEVRVSPEPERFEKSLPKN